MCIDTAVLRRFQQSLRYDLPVSARNDQIRLKIQDLLIIVSDSCRRNDRYLMSQCRFLYLACPQYPFSSVFLIRLAYHSDDIERLDQSLQYRSGKLRCSHEYDPLIAVHNIINYTLLSCFLIHHSSHAFLFNMMIYSREYACFIAFFNGFAYNDKAFNKEDLWQISSLRRKEL